MPHSEQTIMNIEPFRMGSDFGNNGTMRLHMCVYVCVYVYTHTYIYASF